MDTTNVRALMEAYAAVYDEDLRDELESSYDLEEDFAVVDDLTDEELDQIMESIILEDEIDLFECFDILEGELLYEATKQVERPRVTMGGVRDGVSTGSSKVTVSLEDRLRAERMAARNAERQKRMRVAKMIRSANRAVTGLGNKAKTYAGGVSSAVQGGARDLSGKINRGIGYAQGKTYQAIDKAKTYAGGVSSAVQGGASDLSGKIKGKTYRAIDKAKTYAGGVSSAVQGGARDIRDRARQGATSLSNRLKAAKGKIERGLGRVQRAGSGAYQEISKGIRKAGRKIRSELRGESDFVYRGIGGGKRIEVAGIPPNSTSSAGRLLPASGQSGGSIRPGYIGAGNLRSPAATRKRNQRLLRNINSSLEYILPYILEDFINEGHAGSYDEAYEILESLNDYDFNDLIESYAEECIETSDYYDDIMDYLIDEGYASDEESANIMMANMSEEWIDSIIDEAARIIRVTSPEGKVKYNKPSTDDEHSAALNAAKQRDREMGRRLYPTPEQQRREERRINRSIRQSERAERRFKRQIHQPTRSRENTIGDNRRLRDRASGR